MIFPMELVRVAENFIANPPASGVELNELMKLHLRMSMALRLHAVLGEVPREEIEAELMLCKAIWETIEKALGTEFTDEDDDFVARFTEDEPPPKLSAFFVPGNTTLH